MVNRHEAAGAFADSVPVKPYCSDNLADGVLIRKKPVALRQRYIQFNHPQLLKWLVLDLDYPGAALAWRDENLPAPNVVVENPQNGHAHVGYKLAIPVQFYDCSHGKPLKYLAAVERGLVRRLHADTAYGGMLMKNPLHADWRTQWPSGNDYLLDDISDWLWPFEMASAASSKTQVGFSRNCTLFDAVREAAYREVRGFKAAGGQASDWQARVQRHAQAGNQQFVSPLRESELRGLAKSVSRWTWKHFNADAFSAIQRARVAKRWASHVSADKTKPWEAMGICRATYYNRRKKAG